MGRPYRHETQQEPQYLQESKPGVRTGPTNIGPYQSKRKIPNHSQNIGQDITFFLVGEERGQTLEVHGTVDELTDNSMIVLNDYCVISSNPKYVKTELSKGKILQFRPKHIYQVEPLL